MVTQPPCVHSQARPCVPANQEQRVPRNMPSLRGVEAFCSKVTVPQLQKTKARRKQVFTLPPTSGSVIF